MSKVEQLKQLLDDMDYASMMEITDCVWSSDGVDYSWNTDDNLDDLVSGDGNTYSGYATEGITVWEDYTVVNLDTQQGWWITMLFNNSKKVEE